MPSLWKSQFHVVSLEASPFQPSWLPKPEWENLKTIAFLWVYSFLWSCCQNSPLWVFLAGILWAWHKSSHPRSSFQSRKNVTLFHIPFFLYQPSRQEETFNAFFPQQRYFWCSALVVLCWHEAFFYLFNVLTQQSPVTSETTWADTIWAWIPMEECVQCCATQPGLWSSLLRSVV